MKRALIITLIFLPLMATAQTTKDSVTIHGRVTDFHGNPIDSCTVEWMATNFESITETVTNKEGYYTARIHKGKYQSMAAIYVPSYVHVASKNGWPENKQRLEFWAWNFIADRDTTFDIRYHRMEAYGIHAFTVPGAMPTYLIFVRPMSLTRFLAFQKKYPKDVKYAQNVSNVKQTHLQKDARVDNLAPAAKNLKVKIWIDGEEVTLLQKQEVNEYVNAHEVENAYMLSVDRPKRVTNLPYIVFKVELTDLENGDQGEGYYYLEKGDYVK
jgi:hypothetical protein